MHQPAAQLVPTEPKLAASEGLPVLHRGTRGIAATLLHLHPHVLILPRVPLAPRVLLLPLVLLDKLTEAVEDGGAAAVRCGRRHGREAVQHNAMQNFLHNIPLGPGRLVHAHPQTQCML